MKDFDPDKPGMVIREQIIFSSDRRKMGLIQLTMYDRPSRRVRELIEDLADFARISLERRPSTRT